MLKLAGCTEPHIHSHPKANKIQSMLLAQRLAPPTLFERLEEYYFLVGLLRENENLF